MKKHKYTQALRIPREYNEEYVDLLKNLSNVIKQDTPREVKKVIGDSLRDILKKEGIIKEDCILTFSENKSGGEDLIVVLFENLTNLEQDGYVRVENDEAIFIERLKENEGNN